ncbi:hypothetical protein B0H13DRAFT_2346524 [Mycena leptocephala]|nr:hypothetical protein B0H13DRAFT_2346524 [Mycena leptocephala]
MEAPSFIQYRHWSVFRLPGMLKPPFTAFKRVCFSHSAGSSHYAAIPVRSGLGLDFILRIDMDVRTLAAQDLLGSDKLMVVVVGMKRKRSVAKKISADELLGKSKGKDHFTVTDPDATPPAASFPAGRKPAFVSFRAAESETVFDNLSVPNRFSTSVKDGSACALLRCEQVLHFEFSSVLPGLFAWNPAQDWEQGFPALPLHGIGAREF